MQTCLELRVASEHLSYINQLILFLPKPLEAKKKKKKPDSVESTSARESRRRLWREWEREGTKANLK